MKEQLEAHLNRHTNLAQIIHILNETLQPLTSISKLPSIPQLCVHAVSARAYLPFFGSDSRIPNSSPQRPRVPVQTFTIMPQCVNLVRIAYQGMYCLELRLRGGGLVSLRDGAFSRFDRSHVVDEFTPTQGLKVRNGVSHFVIVFFGNGALDKKWNFRDIAGVSFEIRRRERGVQKEISVGGR